MTGTCSASMSKHDLTLLARQKKKRFSFFFLGGDPVQNRPQNPPLRVAFSRLERVDLRSVALCLRWEPPYTRVSTPPSPEKPNKKFQRTLPGPLKNLFPGLPTRSVEIASKKSPNIDFDTFLTLFRVLLLGLLRHFFDTPGGEAREELFETIWGFWGSGVWRLLYVAVPIATLCHDLETTTTQ